MKNLILVRHAAYEPGDQADPRLSQWGMQQANNLGLKIRRAIGGKIPVIWSSPARRAVETAYQLDAVLGYHLIKVKDKLWSDNEHRHDFEWLKSAILEEDEDDNSVLIIVTHLEYVQEFPAHIGYSRNIVEYAKGIYIDENGVLYEL